MAQNYFSIVTNKGRNKLALSAAGGAAVTITHFAISDGNGGEVNPTAASTALVREVWRTPVESVVIDPLNPSAVLVTSIIPTAAGGWWMREFGIFDVDGDMIAVAKPVSQYKPTALEGQLEDIRYEFQIIIGETANVTMLVDPSVLLASRAWVESRKVLVDQLSLTPWVPVKSMTITAPPANPDIWDTYFVPAAPTGAWTGHAQKLAQWNGVAWRFTQPENGHGISLPDGRVFEKIAGTYIEKLALDAQSGKWNYATSGGTAAALTAALSPAPVSLSDGLPVLLRLAVKPNAGATFNLNGLGAKPLKGPDGEAIRVGDTALNATVLLVYSANLACWVVLTPPQMPTQVTGFKANNLGVMAIPANVNTDVKFSNTIFDTLSGYSISSGVYTVKKAGVYQFNANFWMPDVDAISKLFISRNGSLVAETSANTRGRVLAVSTLETCAINDQIKVVVRQESAGTVSTSAGGGFGFSGSLIGGI